VVKDQLKSHAKQLARTEELNHVLNFTDKLFLHQYH